MMLSRKIQSARYALNHARTPEGSLLFSRTAAIDLLAILQDMEDNAQHLERLLRSSTEDQKEHGLSDMAAFSKDSNVVQLFQTPTTQPDLSA